MLKTSAVYLGTSLFCIVFNEVYALYGHGVRSAAMNTMFLYPLLGGSLLFCLLWLFRVNTATLRGYRAIYNLYNSGIALLTVASALQGVMEIAGTSSPYLFILYLLGFLFTGFGLAFFGFGQILTKRR